MFDAKLRQEEVSLRVRREVAEADATTPRLTEDTQKAKVTGMRQVTRSVEMNRYLRSYP
jgi:hypothetical protein